MGTRVGSGHLGILRVGPGWLAACGRTVATAVDGVDLVTCPGCWDAAQAAQARADRAALWDHPGQRPPT